jgi:hypothetical protein
MMSGVEITADGGTPSGTGMNCGAADEALTGADAA